MTPPIRQTVLVATGYDTEKDYTLREAIEWYKDAMGGLESLGPLTPMEVSHMNKGWIGLISRIASREGVPAGSLSFFLSELAVAEINLRETAAQEAEQANFT